MVVVLSLGFLFLQIAAEHADASVTKCEVLSDKMARNSEECIHSLQVCAYIR